MAIATERPASSGKTSSLIPDDEVVILTIIKAEIEEDQYADPEPDGTQPEKLVLTWELQDEDITKRQRKQGVKAGKRIWQRLALFYYVKEDGMPTQLKAVLDALEGRENEDGIAFEVDVERVYDDPAILEGIKAPCRVEQYAKKKGANKGQLDNRIAKVRALEGDEDEDDMPVAPPPAPRAPVKNKPVHVPAETPRPAGSRRTPAPVPPVDEQGVDEDELF